MKVNLKDNSIPNSVNTAMPNMHEQHIPILHCIKSMQKAKEIYQLMEYKVISVYRKKSGVLPAAIFKNETS